MVKPALKPLRSSEIGQPKSVQFAHFGVLNDGEQSKASTFSALVINCVIFAIVAIIGAASKKVHDDHVRLTELTAPIPLKKEEPPPPKPKLLPKPPPKMPEVPKIVEQPKILPPVVKMPDPPKPVPMKMDTPKPIVPAPAPLKVTAPPAPVAINLTHPSPASVVNNDKNPSPVRLGNPTSAVNPTTGPAVANVNLARGMAGMPPSNSGGGPASSTIKLGNGSPDGTAMKGATGPVAIKGLATGVPGGTGSSPNRGPVQLNVAQAQPVNIPKPVAVAAAPVSNAPKVLYKPKPEYTAEALQMHLEGRVQVSIRVTAAGSVEVLGVTNGLGHGLDESAKRAVLGTRFQPATDSAGHPINWEGVVTVAFQLAG